MNPPNKRPQGAHDARPQHQWPAANARQQGAGVLQTKPASTASNVARPAAPPAYSPLPAATPAYRPQPIPRVLQPKVLNAPPPAVQRKEPPRPPAPPAYRPQPTPRCLQPKAAVQQRPAAGAPPKFSHAAPPAYRPQATPGVLGRMAAGHDSHAGHGHAAGSCGCKSGAPKASGGGCRCAAPTGVARRAVQAKFPEAVPASLRPGPHAHAAGPPVVQRIKKTRENIEYAENEEEARRLIKEFADRIDETLTESDYVPLISIAMNKKSGIEQAKGAVLGQQQERINRKRMEDRRSDYKAKYKALKAYLDENSMAASLLRISFKAFVGGANHNISLAGSYSQADVDRACREWRDLNNVEEGVELWGFRCQDKAGHGKGNVGGTLDTRKFQANFMSKWGGSTVNAHVDLNVSACPPENKCSCKSA